MEQLAVIRNGINTLIVTCKPSLDAFGWQSIADTIVFRDSDELESFASGNLSSLEALCQKLEQRLEPFIDYRDTKSYSAPVGSLGGRAVRSVSRKVCSTIASALFDQKMDLEKATTSLASKTSTIDPQHRMLEPRYDVDAF
ncbi:hypothetical protein N7448_005706 [Penicillium atrosanguineum]|uniref:Uncharacterized protein n=1 Tax=Penicillium atrosanguineum TaxID=1132637 RepID=A0A9W9H3Y3_9EURO|nr:Cytochrome P450 E-class group I [Penicillium atrosanguineum]KAJ5126404.1 hypothetical protein N7526_008581 [Penicillium atrosanguineum]KAJ5137152.1 hypothetical protein N7448_005706 [Penicillium atrosanguineum]KAJ5293491.1 Cytochrome P450 E-class group I [Penicillium atrosanguineum]KAJ5302473.1 hypothetical protein N7476_009272 [Penicillium atrosanguineum]